MMQKVDLTSTVHSAWEPLESVENFISSMHRCSHVERRRDACACLVCMTASTVYRCLSSVVALWRETKHRGRLHASKVPPAVVATSVHAASRNERCGGSAFGNTVHLGACYCSRKAEANGARGRVAERAGGQLKWQDPFRGHNGNQDHVNLPTSSTRIFWW